MEKNIWKEFEIIDAHAHIFPGKISEKASQSIGHFYDLPAGHTGEPHILVGEGEKFGVKRYLVCSVATVAHQVRGINDFISSKCVSYPQFIGFGALHPDTEDIGAEVDYIAEHNMYGIKLHPDFQKFNIDDKKAYDIYEAASGRMPILMHMGDTRYTYSHPSRLAKVLSDFPKLIVIAAHLGGYHAWEEARMLKKYENVRYDTSSCTAALGLDKTREQIRYLGVENCFFGTDFPLWNYASQVEDFFSMGLTHDEMEKILSLNIKKFLHI